MCPHRLTINLTGQPHQLGAVLQGKTIEQYATRRLWR